VPHVWKHDKQPRQYANLHNIRTVLPPAAVPPAGNRARALVGTAATTSQKSVRRTDSPTMANCWRVSTARRLRFRNPGWNIEPSHAHAVISVTSVPRKSILTRSGSFQLEAATALAV